MIVRWGLEELGPLLGELGMERPLLVTSARLAELDVPVASRFSGVRRHAPVETVAAAVGRRAARTASSPRAAGARSTPARPSRPRAGLALVAVPTTYAGAEWTPFFGMRDEERGVKTGGGGARIAAPCTSPG